MPWTSKSVAVRVLAAALVLTATTASGRATAASCKPCEARELVKCGHRGTGLSLQGTTAPENTVAAFEAAAAEGADMVELDVQHSADGVLVVIHDDTVDRTTDGTGCVGLLSLAELQALDAGVGTAAEGSGVSIPTLDQALGSVAIDVNVEIKINEDPACPASDRPQLAADVVAALQTIDGGRRALVSSDDADVLGEVEALAPGVETGLVTLSPDDLATVEQRGFDALHLATLAVNQDIVRATHDKGLLLHVWTENAPSRMETFIGYGVDMIISDEPDLLVQAVDAVCDAQPPCGGEAADDGGCAVAPPPASNGWAGAVLLALLGALRRRLTPRSVPRRARRHDRRLPRDRKPGDAST
jgi:glycerophosphoryl diester phosphodiesterase